jgi:hypothetical protein
MFERISRGFSMAKSSWRVIMGDKKLLLFPVVSGILLLLVIATFFIPLAVLHEKGKVIQANGKPEVWVYAFMFCFYVVSYFVIIFCNAALTSCALMRFNGESPTLGDGFRAASARLPQIFAWAVVSATVGILLKMIENAHEKAGYWVAAILGTAWSIMTYFVVPILVVEKVGPFKAVSRSISVMKKTWGESLTGNVGIGLFMFVLFLLIFIPIGLVIFLAAQAGAGNAIIIGLIVVAVIAYLWFMALSAAMHTVFLSAVYQFATSDRVPDGFERETMLTAFRKA